MVYVQNWTAEGVAGVASAQRWRCGLGSCWVGRSPARPPG